MNAFAEAHKGKFNAIADNSIIIDIVLKRGCCGDGFGMSAPIGRACRMSQYAWPASCDSIVSSNGQEDLVSMGANAATKLHKIIDNLRYIAAIELMNAAQGIDFRRPLKSSPYIEKVMAAFRKEVPFVDEDVVMEDYIAKTMKFLDNFDVNFEEVID